MEFESLTMLSNDKKICDYFLISGFNQTRKPYDLSQIYHQGEEICNANVEITTDFFHYKEPIVDIQIVCMNQRERPPDIYHVVDRTYSKQNKADLNGKASVDELYLCFRYGRDRPPITDIWAINPKLKTNQDGWILIEKTLGGHSANLHTTSSNPLFVAYRRAPVNAPVDNLVVTDISVILTNKNEFCPPAYTRVDVPIKRTPLSHVINICYKKSIVKQHVLTFQPEIIYCLPSVSMESIVDAYNPDMERCKPSTNLPADIHDVANFCMPWGATLESWSSQLRTPRPSFVTFVLTNVNYDRMYGAAMLFYENFDENELTEEEAVNLGLRVEGRNDMKVFASKSICLLSRWPLFQTFNRVLSFLIQEDERQRHGVVLDSCPFKLPLERFISQFLHSVPFPTPTAPNILLQWDLENAIGIQLPTDAISKCGTGENFYHLVRMLDVEKIIQLFVYMLTEQKILLTSTCNSDLTGIAEALISMIFPFKWSVVYIPFLYLSCIHIIQSPSPYLIGVDSRFFDYFRLPDGVGCIDLINKSIKPPDLTSKFLDHSKVLPKNVLKFLTASLSNCKAKVQSFEKQQTLRKTTGNLIDEFTILRKKEVIGESIRECFLKAVVLMFKNYQKCLVPLSYREKEDDMFDVESFLKSVDKSSRPLYQAIFDTQLWNHFVLERSYATEFDDSLAFFDRCIKYLQPMDEEQANATSLLHTDSVIKSEHTKVVPPPDPLDDWSADTTRTTFPRRLDSSLMLSLAEQSNGDSLYSPDHDSTTLQSPPLSLNHGSTASLSSPDSSIPVLHIRAADALAYASTRSRRQPKVTMLKRPFEEQKQARHLGTEAKGGPSHAWAGHLLASSYCLWYLSLPGLIGYVLDTPGLRESGLADRILQLAVEMLDSMASLSLVLPDEVCLRVLLLLVHQIQPSRLRVADIPNHADLNAFSYGLCNQILLEEEIQLTQMAMINRLSMDRPADQGDAAATDSQSPCDSDRRDERDCDSGRETLESNNNVSSGQLETGKSAVQEVVSSAAEDTEASDRCLIEIGGRAVRVRGPHQAPRKKSDRMSQMLFQYPMDVCSMEAERSHQFFDHTAGIIMSSTPRPRATMTTAPIMAIHKSSDITTHSVTAAIINIDSAITEDKNDLHATYLPINSHLSQESSNNSNDKLSVSTHDDGADTQHASTDTRPMTRHKEREADPRLIKSDLVANEISTKTRASFRQLKSAANKSLRSMKSIMSSVGSGSWLSPGEDQESVRQQKRSSGPGSIPCGIPGTFKPWEQPQSHRPSHSGSRLKTTASADLLNTIQDQTDKVQATSRPCAGTVQQLRRHHNLGIQWTNSGSTESCNSDLRYEQYSSTNSLDAAGSSITYVDKVWEKITDSLAAVQLPMGKYWPEEEDKMDETDNGQSTPSVECTQYLEVNMTTCSECIHCHYMVYDDDTMNGWSYNDSDLQSLCPYCYNRFPPKLNFQVFIKPVNPEPCRPWPSSIPMNRSTLAYKSEVNYLSPFVLRKELESVLQQEGEVALLRPDFMQDHGILYWNLIWYYTRLSLPSHMLSFVTLWLREKGLCLVAMSEENLAKYEILTSLTGHEHVQVTQAWEFNQLSGRMGPPLYRKYFASNQTNGVVGLVGPMNSPSKTSLEQVVSLLFNNEVGQAILRVLKMRSYTKNDSSGVPLQQSGGCERSTYRELMHLALIALHRYSLNLDIFHHMYCSNWAQISKSYPELVKSQDNPPSESTFYCRKVFRPLVLQ